MASLIRKKYAEALFRIGIEKNTLPIYEEEVKALKSIFENESQLMPVLSHPEIPLNCKMAIVRNSFEDKVSKEIIGLMVLMLQKDRQEFIMEVFEEFIDKANEHNNVSNAVLTVAEVISDSYIKKIQDIVEEKVGRKVNLETKIDERLIAGFKIKIDNVVIDRSIESKIRNIEKAIS